MTENEDIAVEENNDIPEPELPAAPLFGKWNLTEVNYRLYTYSTHQFE